MSDDDDLELEPRPTGLDALAYSPEGDHPEGSIVHVTPVYEGMTVAEAWQHTLDAGIGNPVPEFVRELALGRKPKWAVVIEHPDGTFAYDEWPDA